MSSPTDDDNQDLLLSCRYGDLDDVKQYVDRFGPSHLSDIRDDNGNCILHMTCANGHTDVLEYLLPLVKPSLLATQNQAQSTPLHWAVLNSQLDVAKTLVQFPGGPGVNLIDIQNANGRSPLTEAEIAGWTEGATWLLEMMSLGDGKEAETTPEDERGLADSANMKDVEVEVEIQDAEGRIATTKIS